MIPHSFHTLNTIGVNPWPTASVPESDFRLITGYPVLDVHLQEGLRRGEILLVCAESRDDQWDVALMMTIASLIRYPTLRVSHYTPGTHTELYDRYKFLLEYQSIDIQDRSVQIRDIEPSHIFAGAVPGNSELHDIIIVDSLDRLVDGFVAANVKTLYNSIRDFAEVAQAVLILTLPLREIQGSYFPHLPGLSGITEVRDLDTVIHASRTNTSGRTSIRPWYTIQLETARGTRLMESPPRVIIDCATGEISASGEISA